MQRGLLVIECLLFTQRRGFSHSVYLYPGNEITVCRFFSRTYEEGPELREVKRQWVLLLEWHSNQLLLSTTFLFLSSERPPQPPALRYR